MDTIHWVEDGTDHEAEWHSESGAPVPSRVVVGDDTMTADTAIRLASRGTAILWRGDYHNARQLLKAMDRRIERRASRRQRGEMTFAGHRAERTQRATLLAHLVVELGPDRSLDLRRAPDVREADTAGTDLDLPGLLAELKVLAAVLGKLRDIQVVDERLEELAGCRISAIGVGPDRADTIAVHDLLPAPSDPR